MSTARCFRHDRVSASLAACGDDELAALLDATPTSIVGVGGGCSVFDVDGVPVFAKRIPITDRELAHPHSTANLFDLPTYCQYGIHAIAGPGFGVWRELAANMIVTEGASPVRRSLSRCCTTGGYYPAVHRIASEHLDIDAVVAQFGGAPAVRIRLEDLAGATASLVLPAALRRRHPRRVSRPIVCSRDPADRPYACRRARSTAAMPCRRQFRAPPQGQYRTGGRVRPERIPV
jgi:hypothetical protein